MSQRKDGPGITHDKAHDKTHDETRNGARKETCVEYDDMPVPLTLKEKNVLEFLEMFIRENGISPSYQEICKHFGFASFNSVQRYLKQLEAKGYVRLPGANQKRAITILRPANAVQETLESARAEGEQIRSAKTASLRNVIPALNSGDVRNLPLLGRVAAGSPIEAYEHDEFIDVPASLVRYADRTYALRVQGQSMIEDGILDGDVILVQRQASARNGEIVVAMIGEEATVKRLYTHTRDLAAAQADDQTTGRAAPYTEARTRRASEHENPNDRREMIELRPANSSMASLWFSPDEVQIRGIVVGLIRKF